MGEMIKLMARDGVTIGGYKALPTSPPKGGLVVVQEIFGLNHHIRSVTDRFAADGYAAVAPAIFDRIEPGVELAYNAGGIERGRALSQKIGQHQYMLSLEAAIADMTRFGKVGIVGYCLGGTLSYAMAAYSDVLSAAVCYYGGGIAKMAGAKLLCPVQMHFGEHDDHIPPADVETISKAHPGVPIYTYPAGHGFNCDERASFDKSSADLARGRTLAFFADNLYRSVRV